MLKRVPPDAKIELSGQQEAGRRKRRRSRKTKKTRRTRRLRKTKSRKISMPNGIVLLLKQMRK
jgi:hypothetical protein